MIIIRQWLKYLSIILVQHELDLNDTCNNLNECILNGIENFDYETLCESCPLECNSIKFTIQSETTNYVLREQDYNLSLNKTINASNLLDLYVFYEYLYSTEIKEIKKIPLENFIANIGGILGLFLGLSLLSFIEILETIFHVFEICFR